MIVYHTSLDDITPSMLTGFFVGWPNPPSPETHFRLLAESYAVVLAIDEETAAVVGFVNAISDGVLSAFIPLLEVLPAHQGNGIGSELVRRMTDLLGDVYAIDLACDEDVMPFYDRLGFTRGRAMIRRNYSNQAGRP
ncbi:MAG: GNAT family N-acetyltransferase [Thermomicrobiales bacterium]